MLVTVAEVTVSAAWLLTTPDWAVMVVLPAAVVEARPAALMVAAPVLLELQVTEAVMSWVPPSDMVPTAMYCCVVPAATEAVRGVTTSETSIAGPTDKVTIEDCP